MYEPAIVLTIEETDEIKHENEDMYNSAAADIR